MTTILQTCNQTPLVQLPTFSKALNAQLYLNGTFV